MKYASPYVAPILVVDSVIFQLIDGVFNVLLLKRAKEPFQGSWALPGGYCPAGETTMDALTRITQDKAGIDLKKDVRYVEQLYTFDTVARDPRGHAVSVCYMACGRDISPAILGDNLKFFPVDSLPKTAYDHADIVKMAHDRIRAKITYTNAVFAFLPDKFTLSQLQSAYEAIFGRLLDKRNFRKKFLQLDMIETTNTKLAEGAHRPAELFRFKSKTLQTLTRSFD